MAKLSSILKCEALNYALECGFIEDQYDVEWDDIEVIEVAPSSALIEPNEQQRIAAAKLQSHFGMSFLVTDVETIGAF